MNLTERKNRLKGPGRQLSYKPIFVREAPTRQEEWTEPALRKARGSRPSLEAHRRLDRILEKLSSHWLRSQRAIEALELAGTPATQRVLQTLAAGAAEARLTQEAKAVLKRWKRQRPAASS